MRGLTFLILLAGAALAAVAPAEAQRSRPLAVLMPGSLGAVPIDFVVRNEGRIRAAGIETVVTTSPAEAAARVAAANAQKRKVVLIGMSRGARDVALAIRQGARPSGVVFVSGILTAPQRILGSPAALPATLVVHHRRDACPRTSPADAREFVAWAGGRARLRWIDTKGQPHPNPCGARDAHGFYLQDGPAVSAIVSFIRAR
jgi:dienelactone hydrolase